MIDRTLIIASEGSSAEVSDEDHIYYYYINTPNHTSHKKKLVLNDHSRLDQIALSEKANYSKWVYCQNKFWLNQKLLFKKKISLFFLTDFSCKRNELFDTYNDICNIKLIKSLVLENQITHIIYDGFSEPFYKALDSYLKSLPGIFVETRNSFSTFKISSNGYFGSALFFLNLLFISIFNIFKSNNKLKYFSTKRIFLTRYPQHFKQGIFEEEKYGDMVGGSDNFLTSILSDGMHQNVSLIKYFKSRKKLSLSQKHFVLDDYLRIADVFYAFFNSFLIRYKMRKVFSNSYIYEKMDISLQIRKELNLSFHRLIRTLVWTKPIKFFFSKTRSRFFIYHLHEYVYGRMFSFVLSEFKNITKIGFQHGPSSEKQLVFLLSASEVAHSFNYLLSPPLPDEVLAEDEKGLKIYKESGYKNVSIMNDIYRLSYLKSLTISKLKEFILVAPGLHDGRMMLDAIFEDIRKNKIQKFVLKPHPRSSMNYLNDFKVDNLSVSMLPVNQLIGKASCVYVTYSSVGPEAEKLNIPVKYIDINGKIRI